MGASFVTSLCVPLMDLSAALIRSHSAFGLPLDLFRLVNRVAFRSWKLSLTFDRLGRNILDLESTPPLTRDDLEKLLDGTVPALLAYDTVACRLGEQSYETDLKAVQFASSRISELSLASTDETIPGQLRVVGFDRVALLQRPGVASRFLAAHTFFGSWTRQGPRKEFLLSLFGTSSDITPAPDLPNAELSKQWILPITIDGQAFGQAYIRARPGKASAVRSCRFGRMDPEKLLRGFWSDLPARDTIGFDIEILHNDSLGWFSSLGPTETQWFARALESILAQLSQTSNLLGMKEFLDVVRTREKEAASSRIQARQARFQRGPRVFVAGQEIFSLPSCENETVALYMKLEALNALPFECRVLEYTSREGIDALGDFRFSRTARLEKAAPIEFEFVFENYLTHEHPPEQTALVVCWDVDDFEGAGLTRSDIADWLYYYRAGAHTVPVAVISQFPNVDIVQ